MFISLYFVTMLLYGHVIPIVGGLGVYKPHSTSVKREINPKRAEGRKVLESAGTIKTLFYLSHRDLGC